VQIIVLGYKYLKPNLMSSEIKLSPLTLNYFNTTQKWTHFLSIVGFAFCGLLALFALFFSTIISVLTEFTSSSPIPIGATGFISVFYLLIAVICFILYLYLCRFSVRLKSALNNSDSILLEAGLNHFKSYWQLTGILTIVVLGFYFIAVLLAIIRVSVGAMSSVV
jgi:hypothetical protein